MKVTFILITYCIGCIAIRTTLQTNVKANKNLPSASKKIDLFLYGSLDQFSRQKYSMYPQTPAWNCSHFPLTNFIFITLKRLWSPYKPDLLNLNTHLPYRESHAQPFEFSSSLALVVREFASLSDFLAIISIHKKKSTNLQLKRLERERFTQIAFQPIIPQDPRLHWKITLENTRLFIFKSFTALQPKCKWSFPLFRLYTST
jgi:hypothetical protein